MNGLWQILFIKILRFLMYFAGLQTVQILKC